MAEKRVKIPFPSPLSPPVDGSEVMASESTDRWSEVTMEDGTVMRIKPNVLSAVRIDGQYDQDGNPIYAVKAAHVISIISVPPHLKKGYQQGKVH